MDKVKTQLRGQELLNHPLLNKGTAFTANERAHLGLDGLLPQQVSTIQDQVKRRYERFSKLTTPLEKHLLLSEIQNTNEILFYRLVSEHVREMLPLVYTPTVGDISQQFSLFHAHHRGLYLSIDLQDKLEVIFDSIKSDDIQVVVVTDGERILGLGDLGIGGIAISIGKLSLYTLFGGIHPAKTLPIVLDVGTGNAELRNNPYYQGLKKDRVRGERYDQFIEAFVKALKKRFPKVLLQWEDFGKENALRVLNAYRNKTLSFNDDIQGTAAVALSAMLSASHVQKIPFKEQKIVIFGAGSAGLGIAEKIVFSLMQEGVDRKKAYEQVYLIDREGLLLETMKLSKEHQPFGKIPFGKAHDLEAVIHHVKPTLLIGVSSQGGSFKESMIKAMASYVEHPAIFPLSNPNQCAEADPSDILKWTQGKAIIATGSPFKNVEYQGKPRVISQCNNVYIFPGMGLGAMSFHFPQLTDRMFFEASKMLSAQAPILKGDGEKELFPPLESLRHSSFKIACRVVEVAMEDKLIPSIPKDQIAKTIENAMWKPEYPEVVYG